MHVVVCMKHVLDPDLPPASFAIATDHCSPVEEGLPHVIGPFDRNALEVALKLKDAEPESRVTVLTLGPQQANEALQKALALNVDEAIRIDVSQSLGPDASLVARLLSTAISKLDTPVNLVLAGRQSGDWDQGLIGPLLAEHLNMAFVGLAFAVDKTDEALLITHQTEDGWETVRTKSAVVASVTNHESNTLRAPKLKDVVAARRKPITEISVKDLMVDVDRRTVQVVELFVRPRKTHCEFLEGAPETIALELTERLRRWVPT